MGLLVVGSDTSFARAPGGVRWLRDAWGMDRLIVSMQGPAEDLDDYIDSLDSQMWSASDIDENMFLSDWDNDDHPIWPTVKLIYIGKKGGTLPPGRHGSSTPVQTANAIVSGQPFTIVYRTTISNYDWIARAAAGPDVTPSIPSPYYQIPGVVTLIPTSTAFTAVTTDIEVGDYLAILIYATNSNGSVVYGYWSAIVATVTGGGGTLDRVYPGVAGSGWTYHWTEADKSFGIHQADLGISLVGIRGCGWSGALGGETDPTLWLNLLTGAYFTVILSSPIESEELVPGQYWQNSLRVTPLLVPQPC